MSTMIDADAARRDGFVPLGASRKGSSFRGGRAAANDTAAEIGSLGKGLCGNQIVAARLRHC